MARKQLFDITTADTGRPLYEPPSRQADPDLSRTAGDTATPAPRQQAYRQGKRAVMFFLPEEAFSQMHVILARQGRKKVQLLMEELIDDWFRREGAPRLLK